MRDVPYGFCHCGCGEKAPLADRTRGKLKKGEPFRYIRDHYRPTIEGPEYLIDENGCWIWQLFIGPDGYGRKRHRGGARAHRAYYEINVGPIPDGWHVHHRCRTPTCVNPDHLEALPPAEHMRLPRNGQTLSWERVRAIRSKLATTNATQQEIADEFGVNRQTISKIAAGKRWKEPGMPIFSGRGKRRVRA